MALSLDESFELLLATLIAGLEQSFAPLPRSTACD
jgi:hypothetical protein